MGECQQVQGVRTKLTAFRAAIVMGSVFYWQKFFKFVHCLSYGGKCPQIRHSGEKWHYNRGY